ncbi:MAG: type II toxin-antitoxin system VapC family toxin [Actinomycetota bacterium]|nr:type II toxin-antitoxin system VapC family toxin [Actinomycetota bacterium]
MFVDTAVFLYAKGTPHPYRDPCRTVLSAIGAGAVDGVVNVDVIQEFVHVRIRKGIDRDEAAIESQGIVASCQVEDVGMADLLVALKFFASFQSLDLRDAIHLATATRTLVDGIVSSDRGFDSVPGVMRLDPIDFAVQVG